MVEKLHVNSLDRQGDRLSELIERFKSRKLKQSVPDVHYAIIQFLLLTSDSMIEELRRQIQRGESDDLERDSRARNSQNDVQQEIATELQQIYEEGREEWGYSQESSSAEE